MQIPGGGIINFIDADAVITGGIDRFELTNLSGNRTSGIHRQRIASVTAVDISVNARIIGQYKRVITFTGGDIAVNGGIILQCDGGIPAILASIHIAINRAVIHQKVIRRMTF
ncbi:hypothetical protein D3C80_1094070 [compost metagenome]